MKYLGFHRRLTVALLSLWIICLYLAACTRVERQFIARDGLDGCGLTAGEGGQQAGGAPAAGAPAAGEGGAVSAGEAGQGGEPAAGAAGAAGEAGSGGAPSGGCDLSGYTPGTWQPTISQPPGSGKGFGITIDPSHPGTVWSAIYEGSEPGLYRSTDCGVTWTEIGDFDGVLQVRINPSDSDELYAGVGVAQSNNGFFYSDDGGATWTERSFPSEDIQKFEDVYHIAIDPTDFSHALVSFHYPGVNAYNAAGIAETFNAGASWTEHAPIAAWSNQAGGSIEFLYDPANSQGDAATWLYTTQGAGYWKTDDSGATWTEVYDGEQPHGGFSIHYASDGALYAGSGYPDYHVMRSTDNGDTWTVLTGGSWGYHMAVGGDGTRLYAAKLNGGVFDSALETAPTSWSSGASYGSGEGAFEFSQPDLVNGIIYAGMWDGGVWARRL